MALPVKVGEFHNHHFDSEKWEKFPLRDDDIIIATAYKSGTTWMQNIVLKLVYQGEPIPENASDICPWLDLRVPPIEVQIPILEAVSKRRQLKTHLPLNRLKFSTKNKYVYIGRDGRDCFMSLFNHYKNGNELWYKILNESPGLIGDKIPEFSSLNATEKELFDMWIGQGWPTLEGETDGYPWWSLLSNVQSWWEYRHLPNIFFIHFNELLADLDGSVRKIAEFLEIPILEESFPQLVESLTFKSMKQKANEALVPLGGAIFNGGAASFINKGTNGRWHGVLTDDQLAKYDEVVSKKLTPECAVWLEKGKQGFDPKQGI